MTKTKRPGPKDQDQDKHQDQDQDKHLEEQANNNTKMTKIYFTNDKNLFLKTFVLLFFVMLCYCYIIALIATCIVVNNTSSVNYS
jgi:hypothetical protein